MAKEAALLAKTAWHRVREDGLAACEVEGAGQAGGQGGGREAAAGAGGRL